MSTSADDLNSRSLCTDAPQWPWSSMPNGKPAQSAESQCFVAAMERHSALLSDVLRVLVDMHALLRSVAVAVAGGPNDRQSEARLDEGHEALKCCLLKVCQTQTCETKAQQEQDLEDQPKVGTPAVARRRVDTVDSKGSLVSASASASHSDQVQDVDVEEQHGFSHLRELIKRGAQPPSSGTGSAHAEDDSLCAFDTLNAFDANATPTISAASLVSTTRALGLEPAFEQAVGRSLDETSIRELFCDGVVDPGGAVPFDTFHRAMTRLSGRHVDAKVLAAPQLKRQASDSTDDGGELSGIPTVLSHLPWLNPAESQDDPEPNIVEASGRLESSGSKVTDELGDLGAAGYPGSLAALESLVHTQLDSSTTMPEAVFKSTRRPSLFTTQSYEDFGEVVDLLGGRLITLETWSTALGADPLECVVLEPPEEVAILRPYDDREQRQGIIVCLHGMQPSREVLEEWAEAMQLAGWQELGLTVALPNVQMSAALQQEDLEAVVEATLELAGFQSCLLVGKCWGAQWAAELAASERLSGKVAALMLMPGNLTVPQACSRLEVPVLLACTQEEEEADLWILALDERCAPTILQVVGAEEHRFDQLLMLEEGAAAGRARRFTVASLLLADLLRLDRSGDTLSSATERWICELPGFLRSSVDDLEGDELLQLLEVLPQWIQAGVPSASE